MRWEFVRSTPLDGHEARIRLVPGRRRDHAQASWATVDDLRTSARATNSVGTPGERLILANDTRELRNARVSLEQLLIR
jgi:hypothetical protein